MSELSWRVGTVADAPAIRALVNATYTRWIPLIGRLPLPMRADCDVALREHAFDLVHDGDALIGLIETRREPDHLYIVNVAVSPDR